MLLVVVQWLGVVDDHLQRGAEEDGSESNVQEEFEEKLRMYIDGLTQKRCVSLCESLTVILTTVSQYN